MKLSLRNAIVVSAFLFFTLCPRAEETVPETTTNAQSLRLLGGPIYTSVSRLGKSLTGLGAHAGAEKALSEKWGLGFGFHSMLSSSTASSVSSAFTAFELGPVYAITGSLIRKTETIQMGGQEVMSNHVGSTRGFRGTVSVAQYFFNGSTSVLPYTAPRDSRYPNKPNWILWGLFTGEMTECCKIPSFLPDFRLERFYLDMLWG